MIDIEEKVRVYIAGKLNDMTVGYLKNLSNMMEWAEKIRKLGFSVFVPGLDMFMGIKYGDWDYDDYFYNNLPWLIVSDVLFVIPGWGKSSGVKKEIDIADKYDIPIIYGEEGVPSSVIQHKIYAALSKN